MAHAECSSYSPGPETVMWGFWFPFLYPGLASDPDSLQPVARPTACLTSGPGKRSTQQPECSDYVHTVIKKLGPRAQEKPLGKKV